MNGKRKTEKFSLAGIYKKELYDFLFGKSKKTFVKY